MSEEFTDFEIALDLSETPAWDGASSPLVPPGEYQLRVIDFKQKAGKKAPMIAVTFEVVEAKALPEGEDPGQWIGAKVWQNYSLSDKAQGRIKALMVACNTELTRIVASQFLNQEILATVIHTESTGSTDEMGNERAPRTFANVQGERPVETAPAATTKVETPPAMKGKAPAPTPAAKNSTSTRRA